MKTIIPTVFVSNGILLLPFFHVCNVLQYVGCIHLKYIVDFDAIFAKPAKHNTIIYLSYHHFYIDQVIGLRFV